MIYILSDDARPHWRKIGRTNSLKRRMSELRTGNPGLKLKAVIRPHDDVMCETAMHAVYRHVRVQGTEWFDFSDHRTRAHLDGLIKRLNGL